MVYICRLDNHFFFYCYDFFCDVLVFALQILWCVEADSPISR